MFLIIFSGANMFIALEKPEEELRYEKKREVAEVIDSDMEFLVEVINN